jgi:hypothetical protein
MSWSGVQKVGQGDWHLSGTSLLLKMKALRYFKTLTQLPFSQTSSDTSPNTVLFRKNVPLHFTELKEKVYSFDDCIFYIDLQ